MREYQRIGNTKADLTLEVDEEYVCKNCGYSFQGRYCPNCGQDADTQRMTMKSAIHNLAVTLLGGDSVFLHTCVNLLYRPGYMIHDFICGKRTRYFRPVQMLLCLVTVYALLSLVFRDSLSLNSFDSIELGVDNAGVNFAQASQMLMNFFSNTVAFSLVFAFVNVFPFKWLFRRCTTAWPDGKQLSLNTAEHFFTLIHLSCLFILTKFVLLPLQWIHGIDRLTEIIQILIPIIIPTWAYRQLFEISWWKSLWRDIVASTISMVLVIILLILYFGIFYGVAEVMK